MSTPSLASAGPRPALPPTLQPNAIAAMAPPASRGLSAFLAVGCYALVGGLGYVASTLRGEVTAPQILVTRGAFDLRGEPAPPRPLALPRPMAAPPKADGPPEVPAMTAPTEAIPDTPARLSSVDRSLEGGGQVSPNHGSAGEPGASPAGTGERGGSSAGDGPREISSASIRILSQVQPTYPAMAKLARIQGPVVLRMTIDSQGIPTEVQVASGHHALQAEAVRAARLWRFVPATVDGLPTAATFQLTILFTLR